MRKWTTVAAALSLLAASAWAEDRPPQKGDAVTIGKGRLICRDYAGLMAAETVPSYSDISPDGVPRRETIDLLPIGCRILTAPTKMKLYNFVGNAVVLEYRGQKVWWSAYIDFARQMQMPR